MKSLNTAFIFVVYYVSWVMGTEKILKKCCKKYTDKHFCRLGRFFRRMIMIMENNYLYLVQ